MNPHLCRCRGGWLGFVIPVALMCVTGCANLGGRGSRAIGEIHLFGLPVALTTSGFSQPNSVGVRIFASAAGGAQGVPIRRGRLEVLMFDRAAGNLNPRTQAPLKVWSFQPTDLEPFRFATMMGSAYTLELKWDQARPKGNAFTVVARYTAPGKTPIYSPLAVIAAATH